MATEINPFVSTDKATVNDNKEREITCC